MAQWELIINDTIRLRDELYSRVKKGYVKELHGDLTMTNLYFDLDKNRIIILDPCVASKDMYQIDTLYEFADYLSELICYGCFEEYKNCIDMLMQSDWYSEELFRFYAHRYCLIRATIHFMASVYSGPEKHTVRSLRTLFPEFEDRASAYHRLAF